MGKKILNSRLLYALLAIVIAIGLWFYVAVVENRDEDQELTITGIPITFLNEEVLEENDLMISSGHGQTASLTVVGPLSTVVRLNQEKERISLTVDVSRITSPGEQQMAYTVNLPNSYETSVSWTNRYPSNIDFTVSRRIDKEIPVEGTFVGTLAENYMLGEFNIIPGKIGITGIESEVNRVSHALVTIGGEGHTTTVTGDMGFELIDYQGQVLTDLDVECSVETVLVTMPVIKTADVPLAVRLIPGGGVTDVEQYADCRIDPVVITVSGAEDDLAPLKEILLGEIRLADVIGSDTFEFEIPLNESLENISGITTATVTVTIRGLATKMLEVDNIELIYVPDGFDARSVTQTLQVLVRGPRDAIDLVLSHNLQVVADLREVEAAAGRYTVPVKVNLNGTSDVGVVGDDYKIVVDIFEPEEEQE